MKKKTSGVFKPIYQRLCRFLYAQKAEIDKQVEQLVKDEVNVSSESPWNAPLLIVLKPKNIELLLTLENRITSQ